MHDSDCNVSFVNWWGSTMCEANSKQVLLLLKSWRKKLEVCNIELLLSIYEGGIQKKDQEEINNAAAPAWDIHVSTPTIDIHVSTPMWDWMPSPTLDIRWRPSFHRQEGINNKQHFHHNIYTASKHFRTVLNFFYQTPGSTYRHILKDLVMNSRLS